jgi:hypothetical protein
VSDFSSTYPIIYHIILKILNIDNNEDMDLEPLHVYQGLLRVYCVGVYIYGYRGRLRVNNR